MARFSPAFLDEIRARTPLAPLIGRRVKLERAGRQWRACCPFHGEKTPSFYIYDDGFHCFGCGAHGDAVSFLMQAEGAAFPDAVAQLAAEAGLELPRESEGEREQTSRLDRIHAVLEAAGRLFAAWLGHAPDANAARSYLRTRGVGPDAVAEFGLGWSGDGTRLRPALAAEGFAPDLQREAGLLSAGEDGAIRGEMFRSRLIFPIHDRRGRAVGFGGRTLGDGQPKYLNGPETPVFSKRRLLYGQHLANRRLREAGAGLRHGDRKPLVIAEGYMDVIALAEAALPAVAPLGTALGEEQLEAAWRLDPAPVLCLDADAAGRRAALRGAERALPMLNAERTLRIAELAPGEDPDSLLRRHGADALAQAIAAARPLSDALYDLLDPPGPGATPEQRAAFRGRLVAASGLIADRAMASEYRRTLLDRYFASTRRPPTPGAAPARVRQIRPTLSDPAAREAQAAHLAVIAINHPDLLHDIEEAWSRVALDDWLAALREAMLHLPEKLDSAGVMNHLTATGHGGHVARAFQMAERHGRLDAAARPDAMPSAAEAGWWHYFGMIQFEKLNEEIELARNLLAKDWSAACARRVSALCEARIKLRALEPGDV